MMNPLIKKQLELIEIAQVQPFDENTTHFSIPKYNKEKPTDLVTGKCYLISVEDYIINPFEGFTLHDNWNKGIAPKTKYMNCEVIQVMGKMVKLVSVGYDFENKTILDNMWEGWLPKASIHIVKEL